MSEFESNFDELSVKAITPLDAGLIDRIAHHPSHVERALFWIPIAGWIVADLLFNAAARPVVRAIHAALEARPPTPPEVWGPGPEAQRLSTRICEIAAEEMGWPNARFIPEDPMRVVFWTHQDGLDDMAAIIEIERLLGISISDEEFLDFCSRTLGEFIQFLLYPRHLTESQVT